MTTLSDIRAQLVADGLALKAQTFMLAMLFTGALHRWTEQQRASPAIPVPTTHLIQLYKELKNVSNLGLLTLDIIKMVDAAEASKVPTPDPASADTLS